MWLFDKNKKIDKVDDNISEWSTSSTPLDADSLVLDTTPDSSNTEIETNESSEKKLPFTPVEEVKLDPKEQKRLEKEKQEEEKRKKKEEERIKKEAEKKAKEEAKALKRANSKIKLSTVYQGTNLLLLASIIFALWFSWYMIAPIVKEAQTYKNDIPKVVQDTTIVQENIKTLNDYTEKAFQYRKDIDLIDRAVPITNNYEDNIIILTKTLRDSITPDDKEEKILDTLRINPKVNIRETSIFNTDREDILGIEYDISVSWFVKYQYIKDFLSRMTHKLRVYHIKDMWIVRYQDKYDDNKPKYKVKLKMYSYYRLPKTDEAWVPLEFKENTFK